MTTIIRHESWIALGSSTLLDDAIQAAKNDLVLYQAADSENLHAIDVYDLPRRGLWRVFSLAAVEALQIDEVLDLCCGKGGDYQIINGDTTSGALYCSPVGMLKYGAAELSQHSVNADETMVSPAIFRDYILGDTEDMLAVDADTASNQYSALITALGEASREIDSILACKATTPLEFVPDLIRDFACRIARYRLARYESGTDTDSRIYRDYLHAIDTLKGYCTGSLYLDGLTPLEPANPVYSRYALRADPTIYNHPRERKV